MAASPPLNNLDNIHHRFQHAPQLYVQLSLAKLRAFIVHTACLRKDILLAQSSTILLNDAPDFLSETIQHFLAQLTGISVEDVPQCWMILKDLVWDSQYVRTLKDGVEAGFMQYKVDKGLSKHNKYMFKVSWMADQSYKAPHAIYPPNGHCTQPQCASTGPLKHAEQRNVVLFTLHHGPVVPAFAVHLYCPGVRSEGPGPGVSSLSNMSSSISSPSSSLSSSLSPFSSTSTPSSLSLP